MNIAVKIKKAYIGFTELNGIKAIRGGLVSLIPVLLIGAISLTIKEFPIDAYSEFIRSFAGGLIYSLLDAVYGVTFGLLSVYMCMSVAYHYDSERTGTAGSKLACPIVSVATFVIFTGLGSLNMDTLGPKGMFISILATLSSSALYSFLSIRIKHKRLMTDGSDAHLNRALETLLPMTLTVAAFALFNGILLLISKGKNIHDLFLISMEKLFSLMGDGFFAGLLFVLLTGILWFFGIHGSDVLEGVSEKIFIPKIDINMELVASGAEASEILTKQFFDLFVLMGGCGSAMCLLIALLIFSKRKSNKNLAGMAALPMVFNINEIMVFGLPIIYNPIMLIPFLLVPVVCYLTSYGALALGIVPMTIAKVEWTTPVILGGFLGTGSVMGSLLQIFNLALGVLIYRPFVKRYDAERIESAKRDYDALVELLKKSEQSREPVVLTELPGAVGAFAKSLALDIEDAIASDELKLYYQPQYDINGKCIGAEALLRYEDSTLGMIYPPLIIELAKEHKMLYRLEEYIFKRAFSDSEVFVKEHESIKISVNISGNSIQSPEFERLLIELAESHSFKNPVCIEVTEQTAIEFNKELSERISNLRSCGYTLAIDDFSAGSTSLQYLQENGFDLVKLDGSIVQNCIENPRCKEIASSIVELSHNLGFMVLAEYVSTAQIRDCMAEIGCTMYQGWLFSPAVDFEKIKEIFNRDA